MRSRPRCGVFFSGRRNQFAAIRIALVRKAGILPRNVSSTPSAPPPAGKRGFFLLRSSCFGFLERSPHAPAVAPMARRPYSCRQLLANASIAASRVAA